MAPMTSQQMRQHLQDALGSIQRGDLARAHTLLIVVLDAAPEQPDALQLLAGLARRRGDDATAEDLWRRSLAAQPAQPHVLNNLANLLGRQGRAAEALDMLQHALSMNPRYADAHYNRARLLQALGRRAEAAEALQAALAHSAAPTRGMRQLQAQLLADAGELSEATTLLDDAIGRWPDHADLHHNRAVLLHRLGRHEAAVDGHRRALALGLDDADAHYNLGNTLQSLNRLDEAARAYRDALARQPVHPLALYDLARLRWIQGDAEFDAELRAARAAGHGAAALMHGHLLWRAERPGEAAQAFAEAAARTGSAEALDGLGRCLVRLGDHEQGLQRHAQALRLAPRQVGLWTHQAASQLVASRATEAQASAEQALALDPADQYAWSLLGLAWRLQGDPREHWLHDDATQVGVQDLAAPEAWPSMPAFLADLQQELLRWHVGAAAPIDQTLRHGTQTYGNILDGDSACIRALRAILRAAIDRHLATLPHDATHPFLRHVRQPWRFADSWSARLRSSGWHVHHVHPHGWLSCAFYVQVPAACADRQRREGWLLLGQPDADLAAVPGLGGPPRREIQPVPGRLALFPSSRWHGTRPFAGSDDHRSERMTVSFDIKPV